MFPEILSIVANPSSPPYEWMFVAHIDASDDADRRPLKEHEANARLIAAAPDLLEALEWAVNEFDGNTRYTSAEQRQNCIEKCRAAIAKART